MKVAGYMAILPLAVFLCASCTRREQQHDYRTLDCRVSLPHLRDNPAPRLPVRKSDHLRLPRDGFGVVFRTGTGFMLDTMAGRVTKDLVMGPDTTIVLQLTRAELDAIYDKAIEIRFFDYPEPRPPLEVHGIMTPSEGATSLSITAGATTRTLSWESGNVPGGANLDDWKRLFELVLLIRDTVERRPEYRALPMPRGGYL